MHPESNVFVKLLAASLVASFVAGGGGQPSFGKEDSSSSGGRAEGGGLCTARVGGGAYPVSRGRLEELVGELVPACGEDSDGVATLECDDALFHVREASVCVLREEGRDPVVCSRQEVVRRTAGYLQVPKDSHSGAVEFACGRRRGWMVPAGRLVEGDGGSCLVTNERNGLFASVELRAVRRLAARRNWRRLRRKPPSSRRFLGKVECPYTSPFWLLQKKKP